MYMYKIKENLEGDKDYDAEPANSHQSMQLQPPSFLLHHLKTYTFPFLFSFLIGT